MAAHFPQSAQRALIAFRDLGCTGDLLHVPRNDISPEALVEQLRTDPTAIAHTQLFEADGRPIMVVVSGTRAPDPTSLAAVLSVGHLEGVPNHVAARWTRQDPLAMAPVGHPENLPAVIDLDLSRHATVWVPAGHPDYLFTTSYAELLRITAGTAAEVVAYRGRG
jgi:prolyl-tRNA editing enzyme YbaK/EbsC (Cys-tRNA(Pro) deacylase)